MEFKGLRNFGSTCYLNSWIQALYACNEYANYILKLSDNKGCTGALSTIFKYLKGEEMSSEIRDVALQKIWNEFSITKGKGQQDTVEFGRWLFAKIQSEIPQATAIQKKIFGGETTVCIVQDLCKHKLENPQMFIDLVLTLPSGCSKININEMITKHLSKEKLDTFFCVKEKCGKESSATMTTTISTMPENLIVTFDRSFRDQETKKSEAEVEFSEKITIPPGVNYYLYATVLHFGKSFAYGHYVANCKHGETWYTCNDTIVSATTSGSALNRKDTYIAFYKKQRIAKAVENTKKESTKPITTSALPTTHIDPLVNDQNVLLVNSNTRKRPASPTVLPATPKTKYINKAIQALPLFLYAAFIVSIFYFGNPEAILEETTCDDLYTLFTLP